MQDLSMIPFSDHTTEAQRIDSKYIKIFEELQKLLLDFINQQQKDSSAPLPSYQFTQLAEELRKYKQIEEAIFDPSDVVTIDLLKKEKAQDLETILVQIREYDAIEPFIPWVVKRAVAKRTQDGQSISDIDSILTRTMTCYILLGLPIDTLTESTSLIKTTLELSLKELTCLLIADQWPSNTPYKQLRNNLLATFLSYSSQLRYQHQHQPGTFNKRFLRNYDEALYSLLTKNPHIAVEPLLDTMMYLSDALQHAKYIRLLHQRGYFSSATKGPNLLTLSKSLPIIHQTDKLAPGFFSEELILSHPLQAYMSTREKNDLMYWLFTHPRMNWLKTYGVSENGMPIYLPEFLLQLKLFSVVVDYKVLSEKKYSAPIDVEDTSIRLDVFHGVIKACLKYYQILENEKEALLKVIEYILMALDQPTYTELLETLPDMGACLDIYLINHSINDGSIATHSLAFTYIKHMYHLNQTSFPIKEVSLYLKKHDFQAKKKTNGQTLLAELIADLGISDKVIILLFKHIEKISYKDLDDQQSTLIDLCIIHNRHELLDFALNQQWSVENIRKDGRSTKELMMESTNLDILTCFKKYGYLNHHIDTLIEQNTPKTRRFGFIKDSMRYLDGRAKQSNIENQPIISALLKKIDCPNLEELPAAWHPSPDEKESKYFTIHKNLYHETIPDIQKKYPALFRQLPDKIDVILEHEPEAKNSDYQRAKEALISTDLSYQRLTTYFKSDEFIKQPYLAWLIDFFYLRTHENKRLYDEETLVLAIKYYYVMGVALDEINLEEKYSTLLEFAIEEDLKQLVNFLIDCQITTLSPRFLPKLRILEGDDFNRGLLALFDKLPMFQRVFDTPLLAAILRNDPELPIGFEDEIEMDKEEGLLHALALKRETQIIKLAKTDIQENFLEQLLIIGVDVPWLIDYLNKNEKISQLKTNILTKQHGVVTDSRLTRWFLKHRPTDLLEKRAHYASLQHYVYGLELLVLFNLETIFIENLKKLPELAAKASLSGRNVMKILLRCILLIFEKYQQTSNENDLILCHFFIQFHPYILEPLIRNLAEEVVWDFPRFLKWYSTNVLKEVKEETIADQKPDILLLSHYQALLHTFHRLSKEELVLTLRNNFHLEKLRKKLTILLTLIEQKKFSDEFIELYFKATEIPAASKLDLLESNMLHLCILHKRYELAKFCILKLDLKLDSTRKFPLDTKKRESCLDIIHASNDPGLDELKNLRENQGGQSVITKTTQALPQNKNNTPEEGSLIISKEEHEIVSSVEKTILENHGDLGQLRITVHLHELHASFIKQCGQFYTSLADEFRLSETVKITHQLKSDIDKSNKKTKRDLKNFMQRERNIIQQINHIQLEAPYLVWFLTKTMEGQRHKLSKNNLDILFTEIFHFAYLIDLKIIAEGASKLIGQIAMNFKLPRLTTWLIEKGFITKSDLLCTEFKSFVDLPSRLFPQLAEIFSDIKFLMDVPCIRAILMDQPEVLKEHLDKMIAADNLNGLTPFQYAFIFQRTDCIELILEHNSQTESPKPTTQQYDQFLREILFFGINEEKFIEYLEGKARWANHPTHENLRHNLYQLILNVDDASEGNIHETKISIQELLLTHGYYDVLYTLIKNGPQLSPLPYTYYIVQAYLQTGKTKYLDLLFEHQDRSNIYFSLIQILAEKIEDKNKKYFECIKITLIALDDTLYHTLVEKCPHFAILLETYANNPDATMHWNAIALFKRSLGYTMIKNWYLTNKTENILQRIHDLLKFHPLPEKNKISQQTLLAELVNDKTFPDQFIIDLLKRNAAFSTKELDNLDSSLLDLSLLRKRPVLIDYCLRQLSLSVDDKRKDNAVVLALIEHINAGISLSVPESCQQSMELLFKHLTIDRPETIHVIVSHLVAAKSFSSKFIESFVKHERIKRWLASQENLTSLLHLAIMHDLLDLVTTCLIEFGANLNSVKPNDSISGFELLKKSNNASFQKLAEFISKPETEAAALEQLMNASQNIDEFEMRVNLILDSSIHYWFFKPHIAPLIEKSIKINHVTLVLKALKLAQGIELDLIQYIPTASPNAVRAILYHLRQLSSAAAHDPISRKYLETMLEKNKENESLIGYLKSKGETSLYSLINAPKLSTYHGRLLFINVKKAGNLAETKTEALYGSPSLESEPRP